MPMKAQIGDRWEHFLEIADLVAEHEHLFDTREVEFANQMIDHIGQYQERSYITVSQISFLNRLHQTLMDKEIWTT